MARMHCRNDGDVSGRCCLFVLQFCSNQCGLPLDVVLFFELKESASVRSTWSQRKALQTKACASAL